MGLYIFGLHVNKNMRRNRKYYTLAQKLVEKYLYYHSHILLHDIILANDPTTDNSGGDVISGGRGDRHETGESGSGFTLGRSYNLRLQSCR